MTETSQLPPVLQSLPVRLLRRALTADFSKSQADAAERQELSTRSNINEPLAQDYVAWRRGALWVSAVLLCIAGLIAIIEHKPIREELGENAANFGQQNIEVLDGLQEFLLFVKLAMAGLTLFAATQWWRVSRSRGFARWAWITSLVLPLLVASWPWSHSLDFSHLDQQGAFGQFGQAAGGAQVKMAISIAIATALVSTILPKLLALFPGIIRSSLLIKTLLPQAAAPGWLTVLFAPIFVGFLMLILSVLSQVEGSMVLIGALVLLAIGPLLYVRSAKDLVRAHSPEEVGPVVGRLRQQAGLAQLGGVILFVYYLFSLQSMSWTTAIHLLLEAAGGILLTMVAISDLTLALLAYGQSQGAAFQTSELRADYERRLAALATAGLTDVEKALGVGDLARFRGQNQA